MLANFPKLEQDVRAIAEDMSELKDALLHVGRVLEALAQHDPNSVMTTDVTFCFVLFALQLSVCLWWHDYCRDDFPTLKFGVTTDDIAAAAGAVNPAPDVQDGQFGSPMKVE